MITIDDFFDCKYIQLFKNGVYYFGNNSMAKIDNCYLTGCPAGYFANQHQYYYNRTPVVLPEYFNIKMDLSKDYEIRLMAIHNHSGYSWQYTVLFPMCNTYIYQTYIGSYYAFYPAIRGDSNYLDDAQTYISIPTNSNNLTEYIYTYDSTTREIRVKYCVKQTNEWKEYYLGKVK